MSNPERITSGKIDIRDEQTTIYFDNVRTEVVCGCFSGTLEEFKDKVDNTHGTNKHGQTYRAWIERVERYIKESE